MELTVYIETENEYDVDNINSAIETALRRGLSNRFISKKDSSIIRDILNNPIIIEEDGSH